MEPARVRNGLRRSRACAAPRPLKESLTQTQLLMIQGLDCALALSISRLPAPLASKPP